MATTIKLKNSVTTTNAPSSLVQGEVAINITDKKVWVGNAATTPVQLLGDGGSASFTSIAFGAGTVSNPSITFTGDTNTGIYSPAADTIAFTEGGVESMRIDSSGNVGIGTSSPTDRFTVVGVGETGAPADGGSKTASIRVSATGGGGGDGGQIEFGFGFGAYSQSYFSAIKGLGSNGDGNTLGHLAFYTRNATGDTSLTERMRIDSSGNVGIGTTSPGSYRLNVQAATGLSRILSTTGTNGAGLNINNTAGDLWFGRDSSTSGLFGLGNYAGVISSEGAYPFIISVNASERMRITSGGEVYIAGTTDQGAYNLQVNGTGVWGAGAYVNGSDERIKDNIAPLDSGLDVVSKLNPVTYKYKEDWSKDQSTQTGFIAQELLTALEGKNYVDGVVQQGGEYMSVAYQNIIPILTKAIQEQQAMIEELKQEVAKLKGV